MKAILGFMCIPGLFSGSGIAGTASGETTILHSDGRSVVIDFRPEFLLPRTVRNGTEVLMVFDVAGSAARWSRASVGSPDLPCVDLPLGFPSGKGNVVRVLSADYEDIPNVTIAPVPGIRFEGDMSEHYEYRTDPAGYSSTAFLPANPAILSGPVKQQALWIGSVRVFPLQYNPSTHTVRKYTRMVVSVSFAQEEGARIRNRDDEVFRGMLLNYDVAKEWKFAARPAAARVTAVSSVLAHGDWYRIPIVEEGVYSLTPAYLRSLGIATSTLDPRTIRIFGNGGRELVEDIRQPRPADLQENAIAVEGEADGRFDEGDVVLFYARPVQGWTYDAGAHTIRHYIHHYAENNYYWLTVNGGYGSRMQAQPSLTADPVRTPAGFPDGAFVEEENVNMYHSGKEWFGREYEVGTSHTYTIPLPGLTPNSDVTYVLRLLGLSSETSFAPSFSVADGATPLGQFRPDGWNGDTPTPFVVSGTGSSNNINGTSRITLTFQRASVKPRGWDDWVEVKYSRTFNASANALRFRSPDDVTGVVEYNLTGFTASPVLLNVTDPRNVRRIAGNTGSSSFRSEEAAGVVSEYMAVAPGGYKAPPNGAVKVANQDLRGDTSDVDFLIVTCGEFRSAAERLKQHREQPEHGGLITRIVEVDQIYNEFSGGLPDVTAIRDYLKCLYDIWVTRPNRQSVLFVLFLGEGTYDYKGRGGSRSNFVPTWQTSESVYEFGAYPTDDFFAAFGTGTNPFLVTGRVNARTSSEADDFAAKLIRYETVSSSDAWKMRMLFVADDQYGEGGAFEGIGFSTQTEELATNLTPQEFEKRKVYLAAYPTVEGPRGRTKPGAFQAIIDETNDGALVTNYTGHGNPSVWAHEGVFNVETSIPPMVNRDKFSFFFAATCSFSRFDDPQYLSGSERLINKPDGGAIGVVGGSRLTDGTDNSYLHNGVFRRMFGRDVFGRLTVERPATALYLYKLLSNTENDMKYIFLGDPTMRLAYPQGFVSIDSINHLPVVGRAPQLRALERVSVQGAVRDIANLPDTGFGGRVLLTVYDVSRHDSLINFPPGSNWPYVAPGSIIYRGQNSVTGGRFNASFVVPKDISYADSTNFGRVVGHSFGASSSPEGAGFRDSIRVGGTGLVPPDTVGPGISIYLCNRSFRPGDVVTENPTLIVDFVDSNGINTSASGIGHRIEAWVNGSPQSRDLTDYYTTGLDDYQRGSVTCLLKDLPQGRNTVRVRAWDTHNNPSVRETFFDVASSENLRISDVFNYPNPFQTATMFTFRLNLLVPVNIKVRIYTVAGRLIQTLEAVSHGEPFVKVPWDGRDRDGAILANGVYLYKVVITTSDGRLGSESLGKMAVLR